MALTDLGAVTMQKVTVATAVARRRLPKLPSRLRHYSTGAPSGIRSLGVIGVGQMVGSRISRGDPEEKMMRLAVPD